MDKRLIITSGDVTFVRKRRDGAVSINISKNITQIIDLLSGKGGMEQLDSAGKVSMLVSAPLPPVITSPACNGIQTTMDPIRTVCSVIRNRFSLKIIITSWAIVSLAGGGLGQVEVEECQGENEKSPLSHPRQRNLR